MSDIFTGKICTYYKSVVEFQSDKFTLKTHGRILPVLDVLTNERYTNGKLLNDLRNNPYKGDFYSNNKRRLSAASFSSIQDDLTISRSDKNHLFHTGFISFDIDPDGNEFLFQPGCGDEMKEFLIDNFPFIAYMGKSVSNLGYWGLVPILNNEEHAAHFTALVKYFQNSNITLDTSVKDISRLRFIAYDPDGYFNLDAELFTQTDTDEKQTETTNELYRREVKDELFIAACRWVEAKHDIKFQKGSIHNYLLYLYATLRSCHVRREHILSWVYSNLIPESEVTTNCLDEVKWAK